MRLPFFRRKKPTDPRAQPPGRAAGPGVADSSVQAARTRARRRLIGALVLLAAGVVGFPLLFETQPRPLPVDTPILLPDATSARVATASAARSLPAVPPDAGNEPVGVAASAPMGPASAVLPAALPLPVSTSKAPPAIAQGAASMAAPSTRASAPVSKPAATLAVASAPAGAVVPESQPPQSEATKPVKPEPETAAPTSGRFVVQVGAYNDPERLRAARQKVEKLGYKTYTQDVDSPTGKRTRVRVGPFASRQEADAVAAKVKASGMQVNVLTL